MSEQKQHVEPFPQVLSTDGQAVYSTTGEPHEGDASIGNRAGAVAGPPIGTPAVEPAGYARLGTAPGEVKGSYMVGSKVGVDL
ncbi:hypothetical protein C2E20_8928 [Micractinium conductrix]|uniref:Uncharacterized protein n=1 Tax=Micractinium conductrix TaxID=554055 RepID=A0A2P6UZZ0_9CHLO|nr:hypothetical protein C2E20_8928 [Micractinium conductrix]|eukprot:PSC67401.1 hypothetical protein C2E20_8928 [Micractinium conductrix]